MFRTGQKLIVIQSDVRKKTGPRRGSMGIFVVDKNIRWFEHNIHFSLGEVVFTRYGFEQTLRNEKRTVVFARPIIPFGSASNYNITRALRNCIRTIPDKTKQKVYSALNTQKTPICLVAPINNCVFSTKNEFMAWITSFLVNDLISYKIDELTITKPDRLLDNIQFISNFRNILHSRNIREAYKIIHNETPEKITYFIRTIESLILAEVYPKPIFKPLIFSDVKRHITNGCLQEAYDTLTTTILKYAFIDPYFHQVLQYMRLTPAQYERMDPHIRNLYINVSKVVENNINKIKKATITIGYSIYKAGIEMDTRAIQKLY